MNDIKRRVTFNLNDFIEELDWCLTVEQRHEDIHDVVEKYKSFLSRAEPKLIPQVKSYIDRHPMVVGNTKIKSFISACYK